MLLTGLNITETDGYFIPQRFAMSLEFETHPKESSQ
jgi:hypothetical protein